MTTPYLDRAVALLTQHGKEAVIAPALRATTGCRVERVGGFDTDRLGTFTRDVPREGSQLDAARRKAQLAIELSGLPFGLGSEGSFGSDPMLGVAAWSTELVVLIDAERGLELVGFADGPATMRQASVSSVDEALDFAAAGRAGFPDHWLVVRPDGSDDPRITKGIASVEELAPAVAAALRASTTGTAFVETDGRAHANPTRMALIGLAAEDLGAKLASACPACGSPGWWSVEPVRGAPCLDCGMPTHVVRAEVYGCPSCEHRETRERLGPVVADPQYCDWCNP